MKTKTVTNFFKGVFFLTLALISFTAVAQEEKEKSWAEKFSISGSVDGYYRYNIGAPNNENAIAPGTSFVNEPGFALGMANAIIGYEGDKVGFVADLVFGPRGEEAVFLSSASTNIVNQLYVYWNVSEKVKLTLGNFNTYLGYEVISPTGNFNYSTSYMFSNGPFSHTGLKADFTLSEEWSAMVSVMNPTDFTESNPGDKYTFGAQVGYSVDKGSAYLNFLYGTQYDAAAAANNDEETFQVDLTTGWDVHDDFYLGFNGTYNDTDGDGFYGAALYPQYQASEAFTLGLRGEYFNVFADADGVPDVDVIAVTLTGSYDIGDLTLKPEFRLDSSDDAFVDKDLETTSSLSSFVLGAIYKF